MVAILLYILLGIVIYVIGIPLLESLASIICQQLEIIKGKQAKKIVIIQNDLDDLEKKNKTPSGDEETKVIGFTIPPEENEYYEEEDDDD